jgi:hypothetical protein
MTESEWAVCTDPTQMLEFLWASMKASDRKLRLFTVACGRLVWDVITLAELHAAIEVGERYADGLASEEEREAAGPAALGAFYGHLRRGLDLRRVEINSLSQMFVATYAARVDKEVTMYWKQGTSAFRLKAREVAPLTEREHCSVLRDVFGPLPFRTVAVPPSLFTWQNGTIARLVEAGYEIRRIPAGTLEPERLGVLADALEEAGYCEQKVLSHLRQQEGQHWRGCWVLDLLLNKK